MAHYTTVFLSSTAKDLQPWRDVVAEAIAKLAGFHCVRMEDFGAVDAEPAEGGGERRLRGLVGHLNGSSPEGSDLSFTQIEYEEAKRAGKPRLRVYLRLASPERSQALIRVGRLHVGWAC